MAGSCKSEDWYCNCFFNVEKAMKKDMEKTGELPCDSGNRINPLDAKITELHDRIERNKAELERNNAKLGTKLEELSKRIGLPK